MVKRALEVFCRVGAAIGESPVWDEARNEMVFVDLPAGLVYGLGATGDLRWTVASDWSTGAVAVCSDGRLLVATGTCLRLGDRSNGIGQVFGGLQVDTTVVRFNDGKVGPDGRYLIGTTGLNGEPSGALHQVDPDGTDRLLLAGITNSNGLAWSADGCSLYYVDSGNPWVDRLTYDVSSGAVTCRRRFTAPLSGVPDGIAIDAVGNLWVALWGLGLIALFDHDGQLLASVGIPVSQVSSVAFGGPNLEMLLITTASRGVDREREPHAGDVFVVVPEVPGARVPPFAVSSLTS